MMGFQADIRKERNCRECEGIHWATAQEMREQATLCKRARAAGLVLPASGLTRPDIQLFRESGYTIQRTGEFLQ